MTMDVRKKLVELANKFFDDLPWWADITEQTAEELSDHLIANGVTFAKDIDVPNKWISVKDRLPNCKKVIDGETYFKNVAVRVKGCGFEKIAFYDDEEKYWFDTNFFPAVGEVTHWCELPEWYLPQPPKGE